jgi:dual specificity phosphatase 12
MYSQGVSASEAQERVRQAREQIWIRPGFVEQLVLFGLCGFAPNPNHGYYRQWLVGLQQAAAARNSQGSSK